MQHCQYEVYLSKHSTVSHAQSIMIMITNRGISQMSLTPSLLPQKNIQVSLKDERLNRLPLTFAITVYYLLDVKEFLRKSEQMTSQLPCIVRCFVDLNFLKALYITGVWIGLHLIELFLGLTMSTTTKYNMMIPSLKQLCEDMKNTDPVAVLYVNNQALKFLFKERFFSTEYDKNVCKALKTL